MDSVTLIGWFVQYANRFKVISPESLKGKIIENLEQAQSIYHFGKYCCSEKNM